MSDAAAASSIAITHGAQNLPLVTVDTYNEGLRDSNGFLGDRASRRSFTAILEDWRERLGRVGNDPFGDVPTEELSKKKLDKILSQGEPEAAGVVQSAIDEFAGELHTVLRRLLKLKTWQGVARVAMGGGLSRSRIGELAIGRASVLLKTAGVKVELIPIHHHPDEAGLIGCAHLVPRWILSGHDGFLAVDIGGTNIRAGIVGLPKKKNADLSKAAVLKSELWRHADDKPSREEAVQRVITTLKSLIKHAEKEELKLAPFIGAGCPGIIGSDGAIEQGGQNLPGNWESSRFSLPNRLRDGIASIGQEPVSVVLHNDAVVQGLSELSFMADVERWAVLTIGTGLGNAVFTNKEGE